MEWSTNKAAPITLQQLVFTSIKPRNDGRGGIEEGFQIATVSRPLVADEDLEYLRNRMRSLSVFSNKDLPERQIAATMMVTGPGKQYRVFSRFIDLPDTAGRTGFYLCHSFVHAGKIRNRHELYQLIFSFMSLPFLEQWDDAIPRISEPIAFNLSSVKPEFSLSEWSWQADSQNTTSKSDLLRAFAALSDWYRECLATLSMGASVVLVLPDHFFRSENGTTRATAICTFITACLPVQLQSEAGFVAPVLDRGQVAKLAEVGSAPLRCIAHSRLKKNEDWGERVQLDFSRFNIPGKDTMYTWFKSVAMVRGELGNLVYLDLVYERYPGEMLLSVPGAMRAIATEGILPVLCRLFADTEANGPSASLAYLTLLIAGKEGFRKIPVEELLYVVLRQDFSEWAGVRWKTLDKMFESVLQETGSGSSKALEVLKLFLQQDKDVLNLLSKTFGAIISRLSEEDFTHLDNAQIRSLVALCLTRKEWIATLTRACGDKCLTKLGAVLLVLAGSAEQEDKELWNDIDTTVADSFAAASYRAGGDLVQIIRGADDVFLAMVPISRHCFLEALSLEAILDAPEEDFRFLMSWFFEQEGRAAKIIEELIPWWRGTRGQEYIDRASYMLEEALMAYYLVRRTELVAMFRGFSASEICRLAEQPRLTGIILDVVSSMVREGWLLELNLEDSALIAGLLLNNLDAPESEDLRRTAFEPLLAWVVYWENPHWLPVVLGAAASGEWPAVDLDKALGHIEQLEQSSFTDRQNPVAVALVLYRLQTRDVESNEQLLVGHFPAHTRTRIPGYGGITLSQR